MNKTIAELLPANVRAWAYALLAPVNTLLAGALFVGDPPRWAVVAVVVINAAGFGVARANTDTGQVEASEPSHHGTYV